jgi:hypothetical protein
MPSRRELRNAHLRAYLTRGWVKGGGVALAVLALAGLVALAAGAGGLGGPALIAALGLAVIALWLGWHFAGAAADHDWMSAWGARHGLGLVADPGDPPGATPLLRAGDRRELANAVVGPVAGDPRGMVCHYTYWEKQRNSNGQTSETSTEHTLLVLDLPASAGVLRFLTATPRGFTGGLFDRISSALTSSRVVELESVELHGAFRICVDDGQDDLPVRRLFTPAFMVWLTGLDGSDLRFELEDGCLVVAIPDHCFDADRLDWLLAAGSEIARRVAAVPLERP